MYYDKGQHRWQRFCECLFVCAFGVLSRGTLQQPMTKQDDGRIWNTADTDATPAQNDLNWDARSYVSLGNHTHFGYCRCTVTNKYCTACPRYILGSVYWAEYGVNILGNRCFQTIKRNREINVLLIWCVDSYTLMETVVVIYSTISTISLERAMVKLGGILMPPNYTRKQTSAIVNE